MGGEKLNLLLNRIYIYNRSCCEWNPRPNKLTDLGQWDRPRQKRETSGEGKLGFWEMQIWPEWSRVIQFHQKGLLWLRETGTQESPEMCCNWEYDRQPRWLSTWSSPTRSRDGGTEVTGYDKRSWEAPQFICNTILLSSLGPCLQPRLLSKVEDAS